MKINIDKSKMKRQHNPKNVDYVRNSQQDIMICIELDKPTGLKMPTLFWSADDGVFKGTIKDDSHESNSSNEEIILPDLSNDKLVDFLSNIPPYSEKKDEDADGRFVGKPYVVIVEVVNSEPVASYYAELKKLFL